MAGGLDHLVIVARNLDQQADLYRKLGFQVGARNRHDWGTLNHIVQFDGCFLELLTTEADFKRPAAGSAIAQFASPIVDYLEAREGLAMMVLESFNAAADHAAFTAAGIGFPKTFYFARRAKRPNGEDVEVAFSLAFANNAATQDAGFFVCQQHAPDMFWNPQFQVHENTALGIARVVFACETPTEHADFFSSYSGVGGGALSGGVRFELQRSKIDLLTPAACADEFGADALPCLSTPRFAAIEFNVSDSSPVLARLVEHQIPFEQRAGLIVVPASAAMGVTVAFLQKG